VKIPKKLKIGGFIYAIEFPYFFRESSEMVGLHSFDELRIKLSDVDHLERMSDQKIVATLLHEIVHAIDHVYWNQQLMSEEAIDTVARGVFQVIKSNKFEVDKIPKKINVLGFDYNISYPYVFDDEDQCITASFHERCSICIGPSVRMEVSYTYYLAQVMSAILTINSLPPPSPDPLRLARGLYDVFIHNKWLIPLIKEV